MYRKDYITIATALKAQQPAAPWSADKHAQYTQDVRAIARALAADNPHLDYQQFYAACGLVQHGPSDYAKSVHVHSSACDCKQKTA